MYNEGKECLNSPVRVRKLLTKAYFLMHLECRSMSHEERIVCTILDVIWKFFNVTNNIK